MKYLSVRLVVCCFFLLIAGTVLSAAPLTVDSAKHLNTNYRNQMELAELEAYLGRKVKFSENPLFAESVAEDRLPDVAHRLPEEPLVVIPETRTGTYGGTLRGMALSYESGTSEILSWRQANLVRFSSDNRTIVPNVAKAWEWSQDHSQITFYLRKGHRWSDGHPFTADDLVFYMNDIILNKELHEKTPAPWRDFGVQVRKTDETTVVFKFKKPYTSLLFYLGGNGSYYDPFAPKHFLKQFHIRYNPEADKQARALGFKNWADRFRNYWDRWKDAVVNKASGLEVPTLESHVLFKAPTPQGRWFKANPYYFKIDTDGNQLPYIDYHHERFLEKEKWVHEIIAGRVDQKSQNMPLGVYTRLKENQANGGYSIQLPTTGLGPVIFFNKTHKDPVKKAIYGQSEFNYAASLAINRTRINETLFMGLCKPEQALPQNLAFATKADKQFMAAYDPGKAGQLLDRIGLKKGADGYRRGPDGKILTIRWDYSLQYVWSHELPEQIAGDWNAVGLKVALREVSTEAARARQLSNDNDITNEWVAPFEPTLFASPITFMPPYGTAYPVTGIPWWQWKQSNGTHGEEPPQWVKNLWEVGEEFVTLVPGSDWYNALGRQIIRLNLDNLNAIGTLSEVPLVTVVSDRLANVPAWKVNSFYYGYTYPYRPDQWYFK
ncbi:MAG: ABC transporter substrate-binding protein [Desulfobacter sp.]